MNGYDAQDMASQGADGFRNGYQAGYADAVKAIEAAQPAAAQEVVGWQRRYKKHDEWFNIHEHLYDETISGKWGDKYEVRELYAAPVTAAPAEFDRAREKPRRQRAVELLLSMGYQWHYSEWIAPSTPAAPGIDLAALRARVVSAIERITSGAASMRIPADMTDPDLVLGDVLCLLDSLGPQADASPNGEAEDAFFARDFYEEAKEGKVPWPDGTVSPKGGSEARDAARLDWLDANGFTAYRQIDQIDGLSSHCVVVHETQRPRRGNVHDTIRGAIDAAMQEQANSHGAGVRHD